MDDKPVAVPLTELLRAIPADARYSWTETDGVKATHYVPIGKYAHEAAAELSALRRDAGRWRAIESMARIRTVGQAGGNFICVEMWRQHPDSEHSSAFFEFISHAALFSPSAASGKAGK